jgi:rare lipoprotein A
MKFLNPVIAASVLFLGACTHRTGVHHAEHGVASWYSTATNGPTPTATASGVPLRNEAMTAAHKTLPMGTRVRVYCLRTGKKIDVTITDRGPYIRGRIIDLTPAGAKALGFYHRGITNVRIEVASESKARGSIFSTPPPYGN